MKKKYISPVCILIQTEEELLTTVSFGNGTTIDPAEESTTDPVTPDPKDFEGEAKKTSLSQDIFFDDEASDW